MYSLILAGVVIIIAGVAVIFGTYKYSFLEELSDYFLWQIHLITFIPAVAVFLSFSKNKIAKRIGKSAIWFVGLFIAGYIAFYYWRLQGLLDLYIAATCILAFLVCLLIIWKPLKEKARKITVCSLAAAALIMTSYIIGVNVYENSVLEINGSSEEVNLADYEPFRADTLAKNLDEPSNLSLRENLPRLDGATALYPLYAAFARATYPEALYSVYNENNGIICSRTSGAFNNLIDGKVDVIFLMGVSEEQRKLVQELGLELKLTPIGREAFVFFVNRRNPAINLTVQNVRDIYSGQVSSWRDLGGGNNDIMVYQRPGSSGSQVMLREIMGDIPIIDPPKEFIYDQMKEMYRAVAYKNYRNALGYSFLFYIRDMIAENEIKFLSIDGVPPTAVNIASGAYPYAHDFYAITIKREPKTEDETERINNTEKLIEWILSSQGQSLV
jgi:phosphate transport system substrate-binding protein